MPTYGACSARDASAFGDSIDARKTVVGRQAFADVVRTARPSKTLESSRRRHPDGSPVQDIRILAPTLSGGPSIQGKLIFARPTGIDEARQESNT
jgi:hypothetical protein